jgi:hypothetical protein
MDIRPEDAGRQGRRGTTGRPRRNSLIASLFLTPEGGGTIFEIRRGANRRCPFREGDHMKYRLGLPVVLVVASSAITGVLSVAAQDVPFPKIKLRAPVKIASFSTRQEASKHSPPALFAGEIKVNFGTAVVNADKSTGEIWGAGIDDGRVPDEVCNVGFVSNGLRNTGSSDWKNVTVSATVVLKEIAANSVIELMISPFIGDQQLPDSPGIVSFDKPGTYTVKSKPFDMKPNLDYSAIAVVRGGGAKNKPIGFAGRFISLKFVF